MPRSRAIRTGVAALALLVGAGACKPLDDAMVLVFGRSMRDQRSFDPYENPRLPDSLAVPFASAAYPSGPTDVNVGQSEPGPAVPAFTAVDMARGGGAAAALENPVPATPESLARGQVVYDRMCAVCHGPQGDPSEAPILPRLGLMAAWPLASGTAVGHSDGYIYGMIRVGRGVMPAYGHRITHFDRWHVVNYVRFLQGRSGDGAPPGTDAPGGGAADTTGAAADTAAGAQPGDTAGEGS